MIKQRWYVKLVLFLCYYIVIRLEKWEEKKNKNKMKAMKDHNLQPIDGIQKR